jgi:ribose transport system substrate-binding protein
MRHAGLHCRAARVGLAAIAMAAAVGVAACGSSSSGSSGSSGGASTKALSASEQTLLSTYQAHPRFTAPGPKFNAKPAAGKTVWIVPDISSVPVVKQVDDSLTSALGTAGVHVHQVNTNGAPSDWVAGFNTAIAQRASAIVEIGIEPKFIGPQLAHAAVAHIPVIYMFSDLGLPVAENVPGTVPVDYTTYAKVLASKAAADTSGKAHVAIFYSSDLVQDLPMIAVVKQQFAANCPGCSIVKTRNIAAASWATEVTPAVRSLLTASPDVNAIMAIAGDGMTEYMTPALRSGGQPGHVKVETIDATPSFVSQIKSGVISSDIGWSNPWFGWAAADQTLRLLTGQPAVPDEHVGSVLFDSTNAGGVSGAAAQNTFFGNAYVAGYKALWGLS